MASIQQATRDFLDHCKNEKKLSDKTLKAYSIDLKQFNQYLEGKFGENPSEDTIGKDLLQNYMDEIKDEHKPKTIKRKIATLRAFFNYLEFEDRIVVSPFRKMKIKIEENEEPPVILDLDEMRQLLDYAYRHADECRVKSIYAAKSAIRDLAIIELLFSTGMRVSELCTMKQGDIDFDKETIRILGPGNRERLIPLLGDQAVNALRHYEHAFELELAKTDFFFINRLNQGISDQSVRLMVEKYGKGAGLDKKITPHTFRHSVAAMMLKSGLDIRYIQYFLGHSSITTTQVYSQVGEDSQRQLLTNRHPRTIIGEIKYERMQGFGEHAKST